MKYSKDKQEFSTFYVDLKTVGELKKEIQKVWEMEKYYHDKYCALSLNSSNGSYYFDLFKFFDEKRMELQQLLEEYGQELIEKGRKPLAPWKLKLK